MKNNLLRLFAVWIFIFAFLNFPDYYAYQKTPPGHFFSGQASYFDPWDINNYFALIRWGQNKGIWVENFYTTESHQPALIYFLYTLTGKLFPFANPVTLYYSLRAIASFILIFAIWKAGLAFLKNRLDSFLALLAISLGGGLGWLFGRNFFGADVLIGSFTFYEAFTKPHEAIALALFIVSLVSSYLSLLRLNWYLSLSGLLFLILAVLFYPYLIINYLVILGLITLWLYLKKEQILILRLYLTNSLVASLVAVFYSLHLAKSGFSHLQQASLPPSINILAIGYGWFLLGFLLNLLTLKEQKDERIFLTIWFLSSLILIYLPFPFSRLFIKGLFFPLVILSLLAIREYFHDQRADFFNFLLAIAAMPSFIFITALRIQEVKTFNPWYYQPIAVKQAFDFIKNQPNDGVLSTYVLGNYLPYHTGKKVFLGHPNQTPDFQEKYLKAVYFYQSKFKNEEALNFLKDNSLSLIILGEEEKKLGEPRYPFLKKIFANEKIIVYQK